MRGIFSPLCVDTTCMWTVVQLPTSCTGRGRQCAVDTEGSSAHAVLRCLQATTAGPCVSCVSLFHPPAYSGLFQEVQSTTSFLWWGFRMLFLQNLFFSLSPQSLHQQFTHDIFVPLSQSLSLLYVYTLTLPWQLFCNFHHWSCLSVALWKLH